MRPAFGIGAIVVVVSVLGCSDGHGDVVNNASGGTLGVGGTQPSATSTGGVVATSGGSLNATGGSATTLHADATGGTFPAAGGQSTGGSATGGATAETGGRSTGGSSGAGGQQTGGKAEVGGTPSVGGVATGGASPAGGVGPTGGKAATGGGASIGGSNVGGSQPAGGSAGAAGSPTLPAITDYTAKGPFATKVETKVGPGSTYTVFRPDPLGQAGFLHAPIIFGPGIGQQVSVHTTMLTNFASHGFVVVGTPVLNGGPGDAGNLKSMQDGLDWIIQQNTQAGTYQGKLWIDHAISMGFSVGGTAAVQLGGHKAVATVVSIHGHSATAALHGPMLQTTGTNDTVGMPLQQQTYNNSQVLTLLATLVGAAHTYIESNGGGEERPAIVAWMRYWIYGDTGARRYFYGSDCVLCIAPWQNPQRKNWQ